LLHGHMTVSGSLMLLSVKAVIWAVALGSGTSGGVLAPLLIIGGCAGAVFGTALPYIELDGWGIGLGGFGADGTGADGAGAGGVGAGGVGDWALIGMAATMGGTMRAPLTAMMFAVELTGDAALSVPLLAACGAATVFTVLLLKRSILTEKVARRGHHIVREYSVDPFDLARVGDVMVRPVDTLPATMTLGEMVTFFTDSTVRHKTYPVLDAAGRPVAMAARADALHAIREPERHRLTLAEALTGRPLVTATPDEPVTVLVNRMVDNDLGRVAVVAVTDGRLVGLVARKDLLQVRARLLQEERGRENFLGVRLGRRGGAARAEARTPTLG
ncbi:MAG: chloride channel protein, partial [Acetobacteraceae bacterium]